MKFSPSHVSTCHLSAVYVSHLLYSKRVIEASAVYIYLKLGDTAHNISRLESVQRCAARSVMNDWSRPHCQTTPSCRTTTIL